MQTWERVGSIIQKTTGRRLVGTGGGLYAFTDAEIRLPFGSVEGAFHELCHWAVASDEERRQPNMGLVMDSAHPKFDRMVRCEELAWSLEFYLFGDPTVERMARFLTPEAAEGGSGYSISSSRPRNLTEIAKAEVSVSKDKLKLKSFCACRYRLRHTKRSKLGFAWKSI